MLIGRMVSRSRPSTRSPLSNTWARMARYSSSSTSAAMSFRLSGNSAASCSSTAWRSSFTLAARPTFAVALIALAIGSSATSRTRAISPAGGTGRSQVSLGRGSASITLRSSPMSSLMPFCATLSASSSSDSDISSDPPSTM